MDQGTEENEDENSALIYIGSYTALVVSVDKVPLFNEIMKNALIVDTNYKGNIHSIMELQDSQIRIHYKSNKEIKEFKLKEALKGNIE